MRQFQAQREQRIGHPTIVCVETARGDGCTTAGVGMGDPSLAADTIAAMLHFLEAEIDTARTLIEAAHVTTIAENRRRMCFQAQKALNAASQMMNRVELSDTESASLSDRLAVLKKALQQLGEPF